MLPADAAFLGLRPTPSTQAWVRGFLDRFVEGAPLARLVRPNGYAMGVPFRRLDPPYEAVVELRTEHTRTFGFISRNRAYVADRIVLVDRLKIGRRANRTAYAAYANAVLNDWRARLDPAEIDEVSDVTCLF